MSKAYALRVTLGALAGLGLGILGAVLLPPLIVPSEQALGTQVAPLARPAAPVPPAPEAATADAVPTDRPAPSDPASVDEIAPPDAAPVDRAPLTVADPLPAPPIEGPSFDTVRVDAEGAGLVAGRGEPGAAVEVLADGEVVAEVLADPEGRFVAFFALAGSPDARALSLRDGDGVVSAETVFLGPTLATSPGPAPVEYQLPEGDGEVAALDPVAPEATGPQPPLEIAALDPASSPGLADGGAEEPPIQPGDLPAIASVPPAAMAGSALRAEASRPTPEVSEAASTPSLDVPAEASTPSSDVSPQGDLASAEPPPPEPAAVVAAGTLPSGLSAQLPDEAGPALAPRLTAPLETTRPSPDAARRAEAEDPEAAVDSAAAPQIAAVSPSPDAQTLAPEVGGDTFEAADPGHSPAPLALTEAAQDEVEAAEAAPTRDAMPEMNGNPETDAGVASDDVPPTDEASEAPAAEALALSAPEAESPAVSDASPDPVDDAPRLAALATESLSLAPAPQADLAATGAASADPSLAPAPDAAPEAAGAPIVAGAVPEAPDLQPAEPPGQAALLMSDAQGVRVLQPALPAGADAEVLDTVALDAIAYDGAGEVVLSGRGTPGDAVRLYLNNRAMAEIPIGADGTWSTPLGEADPGVYTLRLDQLDAAGAVVSRIESPFQRERRDDIAAAVAEAEGAGQTLGLRIVQPGNTLWAIARDRYGEPLMYVRVFEANRDRIRNPDLIYPGQVFVLPEIEGR